MAEDVQVKVNSYGPHRNLVLRYTDPVTGERVAKSAGTTKRDVALRLAGQLEKELREGRYAAASKLPWNDFRDRYEDEYLSSLAVNTQRTVASMFASFTRHCRPKRLADVSAACLSRFQAKLRESGKSEATVRTYLAHLQGALRWAVEVGILPAMPKVPTLKRAKKKAKSKVMKGRPITTEEFERMLAKVPEVVAPKRKDGQKEPSPEAAARDQAIIESWRYFLTGLWWSGLRLSEALELFWDRPNRLHVHDLDALEPMFRIRAEFEKGHEDRILPMAPEFAVFLRATPPVQRKGRVFRLPGIRTVRRQGGGRGGADRVRSPDWISRIICRIGEAAQVKVDIRTRLNPQTGKQEEVVKYASAHDLRRSFGERWAGRIMPHELQQLMRHEDIDTTMKFYVGRNSRTTAAKLWAAYSEQEDGFGNILGNIGPNPIGEASQEKTQALT